MLSINRREFGSLTLAFAAQAKRLLASTSLDTVCARA